MIISVLDFRKFQVRERQYPVLESELRKALGVKYSKR